MSSLSSAYKAISDRLNARTLDEAGVRRWTSALDTAALACVGLVVFGLWFETDRFWSASGAVTFGVLGEFIIHWLHMRAFRREEELSDEKARGLRSELANATLRARQALWQLLPANQHPERRQAVIDALREHPDIKAINGFRATLFLDFSDGLCAAIVHDLSLIMSQAEWSFDWEMADRPWNPRGAEYKHFDGIAIQLGDDRLIDPKVRRAAQALMVALEAYGYETWLTGVREPAPDEPVDPERRAKIEECRNAIWVIPFQRFSAEAGPAKISSPKPTSSTAKTGH